MKNTSKLSLLFLLLGVAGRGSIVLAQSPETFSATGRMTAAREGHSATLLLDGRVLLAGGRDYSGLFITASAELYDPSTGTFIATGRMTTARIGHTDTLLPDGRVLIAGGYFTVGWGLTASAELYDPSTGTFAPTGDMGTPCYGRTATLLNDGKVLFAIGDSNGNPGGDNVPEPCNPELYDPRTGKFTATGTMTTVQFGARAILLADGTVLVASLAAVVSGRFAPVESEIYDPLTGTFTRNGYADAWSGGHTGTLLPDGRVLLAGGAEYVLGSGALVANPLLYDPVSGTFATTAPMTKPRLGHAASLLPDGTVLLVGGIPNTNGFTTEASAELYHPLTGTFSRTGDMVTGRVAPATLLNNGYVLITGGIGSNGSHSVVLDTAELYRPNVLIPAPELLSVSSDQPGQGAILHAGTDRTASPDHPASVGEALEIYLTGLMEGSVIPPQVAIGGRMAEVLWFGQHQINVRVPDGVVPGPAVPARVIYLGRTTNEVTIAVE